MDTTVEEQFDDIEFIETNSELMGMSGYVNIV